MTVEFQDFYLVNCYKPNSGAYLENLAERVNIYDKDFCKYVNELKKLKKVIIVGDMNVAHKEIDLKHPKQNLKSAGFTVEERETFTELLDHGFYDSFRLLYPNKILYTWWSLRNKSR